MNLILGWAFVDFKEGVDHNTEVVSDGLYDELYSVHLCVLVDRSPGFASWNNCHGHYTNVSGASVGVTTN